MPVLDTDGMFGQADIFPEQVQEAFRGSATIKGLPRREDIQNVVVIGMGGSGISGDVLQAIASPLLPVPVTVVKGYECPQLRGRGVPRLRRLVLGGHRGDGRGGLGRRPGRGQDGGHSGRGRACPPGRGVGGTRA